LQVDAHENLCHVQINFTFGVAMILSIVQSELVKVVVLDATVIE
jgi:hypothetical protein